jgi:hypothetical protein
MEVTTVKPIQPASHVPLMPTVVLLMEVRPSTNLFATQPLVFVVLVRPMHNVLEPMDLTQEATVKPTEVAGHVKPMRIVGDSMEVRFPDKPFVIVLLDRALSVYVSTLVVPMLTVSIVVVPTVKLMEHAGPVRLTTIVVPSMVV